MDGITEARWGRAAGMARCIQGMRAASFARPLQVPQRPGLGGQEVPQAGQAAYAPFGEIRTGRGSAEQFSYFVPQTMRTEPLAHMSVTRRTEARANPPSYPIISHEWMYEARLIYDETSYVARLERVRLASSRAAFYASIQNKAAQTRMSGEDKFHLFVHLIRNGFVWRLKKFQNRFVELIVQTMAENIVGEDWKTIGERMMRQYGWRSTPKVCAASAPRRFGKTVTLAVIMCAYAIVMAGRIQSVFSTGSRASGGLRDLTRKTLEESGLASLLLSRGTQQETVLVRSIYNNGPQFSTMNFYPSDEKVRPITPNPLLLTSLFL